MNEWPADAQLETKTTALWGFPTKTDRVTVETLNEVLRKTDMATIDSLREVSRDSACAPWSRCL